MNLYTVPFYRNAPFLRMTIPYSLGIIVQMNLQFNNVLLWMVLVSTSLFFICFSILSIRFQFGLKATRGLLLNNLIFICGCLGLYYHEDKNDKASIVNLYKPGAKLILNVHEPVMKRPGSFKSSATVENIILNNKLHKTNGNILLYFDKDPVHLKLKYGDVLVSEIELQPVSNTGNPAAFDYRNYCYLQGIHYQLYFKKGSYIIMKTTRINWFKKFLIDARNKIITILRHNIPGKKEAGLAEALLIGYKDDLDKDLIQSYSNTGVVHVIAISGLHLGLIYAILVLITQRLSNTSAGRLVQLSIIISCIWIFSLLVGGSASVVRSALMFTCIATGNVLSRKSSIYNSLAASAFLLLNYNPLWLWDIGFQLSYAAVLSIVMFQKPVYNLIPVENKLLVLLWKTSAITVSAQILTTPISIYYFHQFPILFPVTNLIAIPLSSLILICEILLCCIDFLPPLAILFGKIIYFLIFAMNTVVEFIDRLPQANWRSLQIDLIQCVLLYIIITGISSWLLKQIKTGLPIALLALLSFFLLRSLSFYEAGNQQKIIVYNIPKSTAIEFVKGRRTLFIAGDDVKNNKSLLRFHIDPSRILHRISAIHSPPSGSSDNFAWFNHTKKIIILRNPVILNTPVDMIVFCGNPPGKISTIVSGRRPSLIVFDSSNPRWRIKAWIEECRELEIPYFSVPDEGAFVMNLN